MSGIRRILALVELDARGRAIAHHARALAERNAARLALGHVADWGHGLYGDDFSPLTPQEIDLRLEKVVKRRLESMVLQTGASGVSCLVAFPTPGGGLADLLRGWQPDLLVADVRDGHGLEDGGVAAVDGWSCRVMKVDPPSSGILPRAAGLLAGILLPGKAAGVR